MSLFTKEKLKDILSCPCCFTIMKPPACLCSNGHSVCRQCWDNLEKCPQCNAAYMEKVPLNSEGIEKKLKCPYIHRTYDCVYNRVTEKYLGSDKHTCIGDGQPCKTVCAFNTSKTLYPVGVVLLTEEEYKQRCESVKPMTNPMLEEFLNLSVAVLEDDTDSISQLARPNHEMECIWRRVNCPQPGCGWIGPVHTFSAHITDIATDPPPTGHAPIMQLNDHQMGTFNIQLPLQDSDRPKLTFLVSKSDAYVVKISTGVKERVEVSVQHYGLKKDSAKFICKMRLQGFASSAVELKYQLNVGNDKDDLDYLEEFVLPSLNKLKKDGYIDKEGMLKIDVMIRERKDIRKGITSVD